MKKIICLIIAVILSHSAIAQSIVIGSGSSIEVGLGADICAGAVGNITGHLFGDGTECGNVIPKTLNLIALIEGFYNGTSMVPDTVTVEFRSAVSPYSLIEHKKVSLNSSGAGVGKFTTVLNSSSYYLVVKHRNSIETWSGSGKSFVENQLSYDFTTASSQAYGNNMKSKSGKWTIYSGDVNQDGTVDLSDEVAIINDILSFTVGSGLATDLNGDAQIDLSDIVIAINNALAFVSKQTPMTLLMKEDWINSKENKVGLE